MKSILLSFISLTVSIAYGQIDTVLGKSFVMIQNYSAIKCNAIGLDPETTDYFLLRDFIIIVEAKTESNYVVSIPSFMGKNDERSATLNEKYVLSPQIEDVDSTQERGQSFQDAKRYFLIPISEFSKLCKVRISNHSFTVGIPTIPAKLRFGNNGEGETPRYFRFEGNLSLGLSGGWKYTYGKKNLFAINTLLGFTIASVSVDSLTTKGKINSITSAASFSPHLGVVFDIQQFHFGIYTGIDFLDGEPNKYWVYRNQPWLGIGIGYNLFQTDHQKDITKINNDSNEFWSNLPE